MNALTGESIKEMEELETAFRASSAARRRAAKR